MKALGLRRSMHDAISITCLHSYEDQILKTVFHSHLSIQIHITFLYVHM